MRIRDVKLRMKFRIKIFLLDSMVRIGSYIGSGSLIDYLYLGNEYHAMKNIWKDAEAGVRSRGGEVDRGWYGSVMRR